MTTEWFVSDSQLVRPEEWTRVVVYARTAEALNRAAAEVPHQMRIGQKEYGEPAVWGPITNSPLIAGRPHSIEFVGKPFRAFPASELEGWLRTQSGDPGLQIRVGNVTGLQAIGFSGRGTIAYTFGTGSRVVESVASGAAGIAAGAGALAQGVGESAEGAGGFLGATGGFLIPLLLIAAVILIIIALVTAPKWLPVALGR